MALTLQERRKLVKIGKHCICKMYAVSVLICTAHVDWLKRCLGKRRCLNQPPRLVEM